MSRGTPQRMMVSSPQSPSPRSADALPFQINLDFVRSVMLDANEAMGIDLGEIELDESLFEDHAALVGYDGDARSRADSAFLRSRRLARSESTGKGDFSHVRLITEACAHIVAAVAAAVLHSLSEARAYSSYEIGKEGVKLSPPARKKRGGILGFKELANIAGLSPWHFHRVFRSVTGVTPKAYGEALWDLLMRRYGFEVEDRPLPVSQCATANASTVSSSLESSPLHTQSPGVAMDRRPARVLSSYQSVGRMPLSMTPPSASFSGSAPAAYPAPISTAPNGVASGSSASANAGIRKSSRNQSTSRSRSRNRSRHRSQAEQVYSSIASMHIVDQAPNLPQQSLSNTPTPPNRQTSSHQIPPSLSHTPSSSMPASAPSAGGAFPDNSDFLNQPLDGINLSNDFGPEWFNGDEELFNMPVLERASSYNEYDLFNNYDFNSLDSQDIPDIKGLSLRKLPSTGDLDKCWMSPQTMMATLRFQQPPPLPSLDSLPPSLSNQDTSDVLNDLPQSFYMSDNEKWEYEKDYYHVDSDQKPSSMSSVYPNAAGQRQSSLNYDEHGHSPIIF